MAKKQDKARAEHKHNIPVDKDGKSTETARDRTNRILNGNDNATVDGVKVMASRGRWHKLNDSVDGIETLFRGGYDLDDEKREKICAYLETKAKQLRAIGKGVTSSIIEDC